MEPLALLAQHGQVDNVAGMELGEMVGQVGVAGYAMVVDRNDQVAILAELSRLGEQRPKRGVQRTEQIGRASCRERVSECV